MELQPASIAQVRATRNGRTVVVTDDVGSVCAQLREIDPGLRVRYSEDGGYFAVYHDDNQGKEYLVLTAQELDGRIVERIRQIDSDRYDYVNDLEAGEVARKADHEAKVSEQIADVGERLIHAVRADLGHKRTIAVPGD